MREMHKNIAKIISDIEPFDDLEGKQNQETIDWINSGAQIVRLAKPDVPNKHLVSYFILFDELAQKILLVDHKKAQLWLPPGGHVENNEDPKVAAERECREELNIKADFWRDDPMFLTSTMTVGMTAGHIDVSLWYIIKGNHNEKYAFDTKEFNAIKWFGFDEIPYNNSDPHMLRFINKLRGIL